MSNPPKTDKPCVELRQFSLVERIKEERLAFINKIRNSKVLSCKIRHTPPNPLQGLATIERYMLKALIVLSPLEQYPHLTNNSCCLHAIEAGSGEKAPCGGKLIMNGWTISENMLPRVVFASEDDEFVLVRSYKCLKCKACTAASNPRWFASLPQPVQDSYNILLTRRGGVTMDLAHTMMECYHHGMPFQRMAEDRNSRAKARYMWTVHAYFHHSEAEKMTASMFTQTGAAGDISMFGAYPDPNKYAGRYLLSSRLSTLYKRLHGSRRDLIDRSMQSLSAAGMAVAFDDTFKCMKRMRTVGENLYTCFQSLKSSSGHILMYRMSETKGAIAAMDSLKKLGERLRRGGEFHTVYIDQCCVDRHVMLECFPWLREMETNVSIDINAQRHKFDGDTSDVSTVGQDAEWTPPFATGGAGRGIIGVLQLSSNDGNGQGSTLSVTVVIDMAKIIKLRDSTTRAEAARRFPASLRSFLTAEKRTFVGVCVKNDANCIAQDFGVRLAKCVNVRPYYKSHGKWPHAGKETLEYFVGLLLLKSMPQKGGTVRRSTWSRGIQYLEQAEYAALDAWATIKVFDVMRKECAASPIMTGATVQSAVALHRETVHLRESGSVGNPNSCRPCYRSRETNERHSSSTDVNSTRCAYVQIERAMRMGGSSSCGTQSLRKVPQEFVTASDEPCTSVKLDAFHFMQRLADEVRGGASTPLGRLFAVMLQLAIFEECEEDRKIVREHARIGGATNQQARRLPRNAFGRRVRRRIPQPSVLRRRIVAVVQGFQAMKCPDHLLSLSLSHPLTARCPVAYNM